MDLDLQLPQLLTDETRRIIDGKTWDEGDGQMSYNYIGWGGGELASNLFFFIFWLIAKNGGIKRRKNNC